jgi:hypothetical protein
VTLSKKKREQIFERDEYACIACGTETDLTIHHRVNRGAGGSKLFNGLAFLLTACIYCNGLWESDSAFASSAKIQGYKLARNANPPVDPTTIPVRYYKHKTWFLLDQEGNKTETEKEHYE